MIEEIRCWWCDTEAEMIEVTASWDIEPQYVPGRWSEPTQDGHEHAAAPPSPGELLAAGARAFDRLVAAWS